MTSPVIIGSAPSSGSTLLRTMLQRHPDVTSGDELDLFTKPQLFAARGSVFRHLAVRSWRRGLPRDLATGGSAGALFTELWDWTTGAKEIEPLIDRCDNLRELVDRFFVNELRAQGGTRWLEKTPDNALRFQEIAELYPDAVLIHVTRDPRDVVSSLVARDHSHFRAASRWYRATLAGLAAEERLGALRVPYEGLVSDPAAVVRRVCKAARLDYDDALIDPTRSDESRGRHRAVEERLVDSWTLSQNAAVSTEAVGRHLRDPPDAQRLVEAHIKDISGRGPGAPPGASVVASAGYEPVAADTSTNTGDVRASMSEAIRHLLSQVRLVGRYTSRPSVSTTLRTRG